MWSPFVFFTNSYLGNAKGFRKYGSPDIKMEICEIPSMQHCYTPKIPKSRKLLRPPREYGGPKCHGSICQIEDASPVYEGGG